MARTISRLVFVLSLGLIVAGLVLIWGRREHQAAAPPTPRVERERQAAAPPTHRVDEISPLGVRRGFTTELTLHGSLLSGNPRLVAPFRFVEEKPPPTGSDASTFKTRLTVDPETLLGIYPVRVLTDEGLSNPFALAIGQLPQIPEKEDNNDYKMKAQFVALPTVIEGRLPQGDHDNFRFRGEEGQRIVASLEAAEIGSGIDPGRLSLVSLDRHFSSALTDPSIKLPKDDDYLFFLSRPSRSEIKGGPPVYRLTIGELPMALEIYPWGGRRGETIRVELRGGPVGVGKVVPVTLDPLPGESIVRLRVPSHMPGPDGRPLDFEWLTPLVVSDLPERLEPTAADAPPLRAVAPVVFNGRIDPIGDEDRFTLSVTPGQRLRAEVAAGDLGSPLMAVLIVLDARGKELHKVNNKYYDRTCFRKIEGFEYFSIDPSVEFTVPDGQTEVTLVVHDYFSDPLSFVFDRGRSVKQIERGGLGFVYRLTVVPVEPRFAVGLNDAQVSVPKGGTAAVGVSVTRQGYRGPITLRVTNAPPGLTVRPGSIAEGQTVGAFTVTAAPDSTFAPLFLDVIGEGRGPEGPITARASKVIFFGEPMTPPMRFTTDVIDGKPQYYEVPPYLRTRIRTQPGLLIATTQAAPITLDAPIGPILVTQGHTATFKVTATRPKGPKGP